MSEIKDITAGVNIDDEAGEVEAGEVEASEVDASEVESVNDEADSEVESAKGEGSEVDDTDDDASAIDENELSHGGNDHTQQQQSGGAEGDIEIEIEEEGSDIDEEEDEDDYLQKFNQQMRDDLILNFHPESKSHNYEEIKQLAKVTRNKNGIIVDELHKTIPLLTKYEKTRILGQRAKQIECGAVPLIQVPPNIIDSYLIANLELEQNKIPFIIRRPLPNGGMEYWYVSDLENV